MGSERSDDFTSVSAARDPRKHEGGRIRHMHSYPARPLLISLKAERSSKNTHRMIDSTCSPVRVRFERRGPVEELISAQGTLKDLRETAEERDRERSAPAETCREGKRTSPLNEQWIRDLRAKRCPCGLKEFLSPGLWYSDALSRALELKVVLFGPREAKL